MKSKDINSPENLIGYSSLKSLKDIKVISQWLTEIKECEVDLKRDTRSKRDIKNENKLKQIHESDDIITPKPKHSIECSLDDSNKTTKATIKKHARIIELNK